MYGVHCVSASPKQGVEISVLFRFPKKMIHVVHPKDRIWESVTDFLEFKRWFFKVQKKIAELPSPYECKGQENLQVSRRDS